MEETGCQGRPGWERQLGRVPARKTPPVPFQRARPPAWERCRGTQEPPPWGCGVRARPAPVSRQGWISQAEPWGQGTQHTPGAKLHPPPHPQLVLEPPGSPGFGHSLQMPERLKRRGFVPRELPEP